ncbi:threonine synthase [Halegenticoccus tardaugens]|uniref:threonine synthase n=1 Tax=Halegenticoccus tardaugens TaxID=2071624 RepID=UPI00100A5E5B|nr:threonine synthase [Halegenticoccus tardaugens]
MTLELACDACDATARASYRCECGESLWVETDPHGFDWNSTVDAPGVWRYAALLPDSSPGGVADAAGGTPLVRTRGLDEYAGVRVHVKDEGENPTGSFKDRGSALGVARALSSGTETVGTVSHGNMAMSTAAHAASAGLDCVVLVPDDIPPERLGVIAQYGPTVLRVEGDYGRLYEESLRLGEERGVAFLNSDAPLRVEGQKTTALEICEVFAPDAPDAIVAPVSSGGHASAIWKAVRELAAAGAIARVPRLYFAQAAACAPIADAFEAGAEGVEPVDAGKTVAYSIANADPPSGRRALAAARETGGAVAAVTDEEIVTAKERFAREAGFCVETSSATTLAAARKLSEVGELADDEDVVLVATGSGFKEARTGADASTDAATVGLEDLGGRLATL